MSRGKNHTSFGKAVKSSSILGNIPSWEDHSADALRELLPNWEKLQATAGGRHHKEANVLVHIEMVVDALIADPEFQALDAERKEALYLAAAMHDVAKSWTARLEDGTMRFPHHAPQGARETRNTLIQAGAHPAWRELSSSLVGMHMQPLHILDKKDPQRTYLLLSRQTDMDLLKILTRADGLGRLPAKKDADFSLKLLEEDMSDMLAFNDPYSTYLWGEKEDRSPYYKAHIEKEDFEIILTCGLPGSGKSTWAKEQEMPIISPDDYRNRGIPLAQMRDDLRVHLRKKQTVIFDATHMRAQDRSRTLSLARDYGAWPKIKVFETSLEECLKRNRDRDDAARVPEEVIYKMLHGWEYPSVWEAVNVEMILDQSQLQTKLPSRPDYKIIDK